MIVISQSGTEANQSESIGPNPIKKELICFLQEKPDLQGRHDDNWKKWRVLINSVFILHSCSVIFVY